MHESSLSRQLLAVVLERAHGAGTRHVLGVRARLTETESLDARAIELHFRALSRGTLAEGARLDLRLHHTEARCDACGAMYAPEHHLILCPSSGSTEAALLGEPELGIESIDVE